jgi:hypothetical protein
MNAPVKRMKRTFDARKQELFDKRKRLDELLKADVPILKDAAQSIGLDVERLNLVLTEYSNLIEQCLLDIERDPKKTV